MNNFIVRTLSGAVFVLLVIGSILWHQYAFIAVFSLIAAGAVREFHKITNVEGQIVVPVILGVIGALLLFMASFFYASGSLHISLYPVYGLYLVMVLIAELYRKKANPVHNWAYFILGQLIIALPFSLLNFISFVDGVTYKPLLLIALFATIWINDTGAYIIGVSFGKHRLFERVSPKKSWEGFFGGALAALAAGYVFSVFIPDLTLVQWLLFSQIVVVFGTFGDLIESLLKRTIGTKDSGNILPGHGGFLDRFDSMLLAAPVIFIYLSFLF